jgi:hypothetical protein
MRVDDATEILQRNGYECKAQYQDVRCINRGTFFIDTVDIKGENQFMRSARGSHGLALYVGGRTYFEVQAPGLKADGAEPFARYIAERLRLKLAVRVGGYRYSTEYLAKRLGMTCTSEFAADATVPDVRCATASLDGQKQNVILHLSEDALPTQLEAIIGDSRATIALSARPDRTDDGGFEVAVRELGKALRMLVLPSRPELQGFSGDKMQAAYAALDEPSKQRVQRAVARQLDAIYTTDDDETLRPVLQQIDYGALFLRRFGTVRGGSVTARNASTKTYAAFAFAECDSRAAFDARTCFLQYANQRPELAGTVERAMVAVKTANPGLDPQHPISQRLQRLDPLLKESPLK